MRFNREQFPEEITPEQFKLLRHDLGFTVRQWGRALGFTGKLANVSLSIRRMEKGEKDISASTRRLCLMFARFGVPVDLMPPDDLTLGREEEREALEEKKEARSERQ